MISNNRALRLMFPIAMLVLSRLLWVRISTNVDALENVPNAVGPGGWPRAMIVGLVIFSLLYLFAELFKWRTAAVSGLPEIAAQSTTDNGNQLMALIGICAIIAYGVLIPVIGFAFATMAFIAVWCLLGNVRPVLGVALISILGTVVLLYMFVALAKMPLNRGYEPFGSWTVSIYRLLRIY